MAQGREWTTEERETIIQSLKSYLELGFSRNKACNLIGLTPSTLSNWVQADEALGMRIQGWENAINKLAMQNVRDNMMKEGEDGKAETSKWWLERRMKDDFSTKNETDLNVKELPKPILDDLQEDNSNKEDNKPQEEN